MEVSPEQAARFARVYVTLTEALMREGVPEDEARFEARSVAYLIVFEDLSGKEVWED